MPLASIPAEIAIGRCAGTRRDHLAWLLGTLVSSAPWCEETRESSSVTGAAEVLRDTALSAMRRTDSTPSWFTSSNWDNRSYQPWTDYLAGKLGDAEFAQVCANPSDYCLRDVWNLRLERPARIDWASNTPFNWNGVHALALRFFRTGEDVYLRKWLSVVEDYADWTRGESGRSDGALQRGAPQAVLDAAMTWGGIFTAWSIIARGLRPGPVAGASPYSAVAAEAASGEFERLPAAQVKSIAAAFAHGQAVPLARYYAQANYIPNQRAFGLEALAMLAAFFPRADGVVAWRDTLHASVLDLASRYKLPDGGQLEPSFNYAQALIDTCQRVAKLPFDTVPVWRDAALATVDDWWRLAAALATPEGALPQLGNAAWGRFGRAASPPQFAVTSLAFPYSGLYVMRSRWTADTPYLFFYHRRAARGHAMAGSNSIQLAVFGRQLLGAGGSAVYGGLASRRPEVVAYLGENSSWKTCTVLVDGRSQAGGDTDGLPTGADGRPDILRAPTTPARALWHASSDFDVVEAEYREGYRGTIDEPQASLVSGVSHLRRVVFVRELGLWCVVDVLRADGAHQYTQVWKFAPPRGGVGRPGFEESQIDVRPRDRLVETNDAAPDSANLRLHHFGSPALQYRRYFGSGAFGWFATGPLSVPVPACDVHAQWQGSGPQVLVTLLVPMRGRESPVADAKDVSAAGIAGASIEVRDGTRLQLWARPEPGDLPVRSIRARAEFVLRIERKGKPDRGIVLGMSSPYAFVGDTRRPIAAPTRFGWRSEPGGALSPTYDAGR